MPQTLSPEWYEMLGESADLIHSEWLHTIGNLTLTGYNPELGNRPYADKKRTFALSHVELNRYFSQEEHWGAKEIALRAAELFRIATRLWPRPNLIPRSPELVPAQKAPPAAFHSECIKLAQQFLGLHLSKLSQTR